MDGRKREHTGISSSIALLQERFRQLEQVRERREEKQIQKQVLESERIAPSLYFEPGKSSFFQHEILMERSLSNRRNTYTMNYNAGLQNVEGQVSSYYWYSESDAANASDKLEYSEVDTSLRL